MQNLLDTLNLNFTAGPLNSAKLNEIVSSIRLLQNAVNGILKSFFDANFETGTQKPYTLGEAIALVPESRRSFGMRIRFVEFANEASNGSYYNIRYVEYYYVGPRVFTSAEWNALSNWRANEPNIIDGGVW